MADWALEALGGLMCFIIARWDLQKPVAIKGKGFETFLHYVHALSQQLLPTMSCTDGLLLTDAD